MRTETSSARFQAAYFATNFTMLAENPWFARVTTEVVASTRDHIPNCSIPIVRIKKRYRKKRATALPMTCTKVVAAFRNTCLFFKMSHTSSLDDRCLLSDGFPSAGRLSEQEFCCSQECCEIHKAERHRDVQEKPGRTTTPQKTR